MNSLCQNMKCELPHPVLNDMLSHAIIPKQTLPLPPPAKFMAWSVKLIPDRIIRISALYFQAKIQLLPCFYNKIYYKHLYPYDACNGRHSTGHDGYVPSNTRSSSVLLKGPTGRVITRRTRP